MPDYLLPDQAPTREEVDSFEGPVLLEFGTGWCGYCRAVEPHVRQLLPEFPDIHHVKVEDGSGRPLGRSFRVKLWPTLVFLRDGQVVQQSARPERAEIERGVRAITETPAGADQPASA